MMEGADVLWLHRGATSRLRYTTFKIHNKKIHVNGIKVRAMVREMKTVPKYLLNLEKYRGKMKTVCK